MGEVWYGLFYQATTLRREKKSLRTSAVAVVRWEK